MKKIFYLLCFNFFCQSVLHSEYDFELLTIPFGVRATGAGGNFVSMYDTSEGLFYNPAAVVASKYSELSLSHHIFYAETSIQQLAFNIPFNWFGLGVAASRLSVPEISIVDNYYHYEQTYNMSSLLSGVVLSFAPIKNICFGVAPKYIQKEIFKEKNSSMLYDLGFILRTSNDLFSIGGSLQNFLYGETKYNLPTIYNIGLKFCFDLPQQATKINILASAKINYFTNDIIYNFGIEHWGADVLGIRVGYVVDEKKSNLDIYEQVSFFTAGISLNIANFGIDYAYLPDSALGATHNIGINFKFKTKKKEEVREIPCNLTVEPTYFSPNNDGYLDNVFFRHSVSTSTEITEILYSIKDINDKEVFVFRTTFVPTVADIFYSFDGKDLNGKVLPDGEYFVEFLMRQQQEKRTTIYKSSKESFILDTTCPSINIKLSTSTFSPDGDSVDDVIKFFVSISDELSPIESIDCSILNFKNQKIYKYKIEVSSPQKNISLELNWDGKDEIYERVVPNGDYRFVLTSKDKAGNSSTKEEKFKVYVVPKQTQKIVVEKQQEIFYIKGAKVTVEDRGIIVTYPTDDLFIKETKEISPNFYSSLDTLADIIKTKYSNRKILIEGHTDSVGDEKENKAKSSAFAWKVYSYLVKNCGVDARVLDVRGVGEERPIASNKTKLGRAKNRRIEIIIPHQ